MPVYKYRKEIGKIRETMYRPVATVEILGKDGLWYYVTAYIDSGADISLIPYSLGKSMGYEVDKSEIIELEGVGGKSIPIVVINTKIRFSENLVYDAEIGWSLVDGVPILLGRHTIFDKFKITFLEKERKIIFEPI